MDVRKKLVEIVCDVMESDGCIGHCNHSPCFEVERVVNTLIANGVTVQEWISVDDRLPDKDGCYIVTACDEGCSCGDGIWYDTVVIEAEHYKGEWSWNENGTEYDITDLVTHWMPLPLAPEVKND